MSERVGLTKSPESHEATSRQGKGTRKRERGLMGAGGGGSGNSEGIALLLQSCCYSAAAASLSLSLCLHSIISTLIPLLLLLSLCARTSCFLLPVPAADEDDAHICLERGSL